MTLSAEQLIRTGSADDVGAVVGLLDRTVEWLVAQGRTGQWGDQPWSASEAKVERIRGMITGPAMSCSSWSRTAPWWPRW